MSSRKFNFGISSLLWGMLVAALAFGWWTTSNEQTQRIESLERRIEQMETAAVAKKKLFEANVALAELKVRLGPRHPRVVQTENQIKTLRKLIVEDAKTPSSKN